MSETSVVNRVVSACDFILRHQNNDGGIPAVGISDGSGCWTSAATLEALISPPFFYYDEVKIEKLIQFLINEQNNNTNSKKLYGSWSLTAGGKHGSTLATAHAVIALSKAMIYFKDHINLRTAIDSGKQWLLSAQNPDDGGWGVEPYGGKVGAESRMVSTFMVLKAFGVCGETIKSSRAARLGVNWIFSVYNSNGGFRASKNSTVDPCSTARACMGIFHVGALNERQDLIVSVSNYLSSSKPEEGIWNLSQESYIPDGASGQIFFHQNTTAELLGFLSEVKLLPSYQLELIRWFKLNQNDDGGWCLGANSDKHYETVTWSTADAIFAIKSFIKGWEFSYVVQVSNKNCKWKEITFILISIISIVEFFLIIRAPNLVLSVVADSWNELPEDFKVSSIWSFVLGVISSIVATVIGVAITHVFKKRD